MADCSDVPLGSKLVVLLKTAIEPIKKNDLLQMLGLEQMDKAKQNEFRNQVNIVLDTAVNLGFVQTINGYYMPITHASDIADILGFDGESYVTSSTSSVSLISAADSLEQDNDEVEMGTRLIFCLNTLTEPVRKDVLLSMMGLNPTEESKANDVKNEIDTVLDEAVNLGFVQTYNGHYMPITHATDIAEILEMDENENVCASTSSLLGIVTDNLRYIITDNDLSLGEPGASQETDTSNTMTDIGEDSQPAKF